MRSERDLPQLEVEHSGLGDVQLVALAGELDLPAVGELEAVLSAAAAAGDGPPRVCLDLSELVFIDSSGLATIIRAHQAIAGDGGTLAIVCAPGAVRRTFDTTGLMRMLTIVDARDAAIAAVRR